MTVITRFPPSPTGSMHIGNARTALFNYLYARHHGGKFVLRIEDTDKKRSTPEAVEIIFKSLEWLGLDWDNQKVVFQSKNLERHTEIAQTLLENDKAYRCYCTPEELDTMRKEARAAGKPPVYDRRWRDKTETDWPKNKPYVVRIKAPIEGSTVIEDQVQGRVEVENTQLDDFILLRSDGSPTYMLSVVVDDHDMGVTHILRGNDHLNNAFRQKVIFDAMGWNVPVMGHLPLIVGPDGSKYSKRHGAVGVLDFRDEGYLPEALRNQLLRLGWGHGNDEIISDAQAIEWFDLDGIGKSSARFDFDKLNSFNTHYIAEANAKRLIDLARPFYESRHGLTLGATAESRILAGIDELKSRAKTLLQFVDESAFYAKTAPFDYDEKAKNLIEDKAALQALYDGLSTLDPFDADGVKTVCKTVADTLFNGKLGKVAMPLRAALTGTTVSPSIFDAAVILGKEETLTRMEHAIKSP